MFERFTDPARSVVISAKTKAAERGDDQILPVHMLYGLTATEGLAAAVLARLGADTMAVERQLEAASRRRLARPRTLKSATTPKHWRRSALTLKRSSARSRTVSVPAPSIAFRSPPVAHLLNWTGRLPLSDQSKLTLAFSLREARALRHSYIGTEHVLLGTLRVAERDPRGEFAAITLRNLGHRSRAGAAARARRTAPRAGVNPPGRPG